MTITTDTSTVQPEVPAWLNLDVICPPDVRENIKTASEKLRAVVDGEELADAAFFAIEAVKRFTSEGARVDVAPDLGDIYELLCRITGFQELWDAALRLVEISERIQGAGVAVQS